MYRLQYVLLIIGITYVYSHTEGKSLRIPLRRLIKNITISNDEGKEELVSKRNYYIGTISVGKPARQYELHFDTGSPTPWINGPRCTVDGQRSCGNEHHTYDVSQSETGKLTGKPLNITYGKGYTLGELVTDSVALSGTDSEFGKAEITFGIANQVDSDTDGMEADGLFGLSFSGKGDPKSPIEVWSENNVFDGDMFTVWMDKNIEKNGEVVFGSLIKDKCGDVVLTAPSFLNKYWWDFKVDHLKYDGNVIDSGVIAVSDTGSTDIVFPTKYGNLFPDLFSQDFDTVARHNLTFSIRGYDITIQGKDLFRGVSILNNDKIILGDTFIRQFCQVHYIKTREVGFALNIAP